jgi:hypothetical protein
MASTRRSACRRTPALADSIVAVIGIVITRIPVVDIRCEPIPVKKGRTSERSGEKPGFLEKDRPGEKPVFLAAKVPSRKKPVLLAAKVHSPVRKWETHVHAAPTIPALRDSVRWFPDCQRGHPSEKCDTFQHDGLHYLNAPPHLTYRPTHVTARIPSEVGKRGQWLKRRWPSPPSCLPFLKGAIKTISAPQPAWKVEESPLGVSHRRNKCPTKVSPREGICCQRGRQKGRLR